MECLCLPSLSLLLLLLLLSVELLLRFVERFFFLDFDSFPFALLNDADAASVSVDDPPRGIRNDKNCAACLLVLLDEEILVVVCVLSRHDDGLICSNG